MYEAVPIENTYWQEKFAEKREFYKPYGFKPGNYQLPSQSMGFLENPFEGDKLKQWVMNPLTLGLVVIIAISLMRK